MYASVYRDQRSMLGVFFNLSLPLFSSFETVSIFCPLASLATIDQDGQTDRDSLPSRAGIKAMYAQLASCNCLELVGFCCCCCCCCFVCFCFFEREHVRERELEFACGSQERQLLCLELELQSLRGFSRNFNSEHGCYGKKSHPKKKIFQVCVIWLEYRGTLNPRRQASRSLSSRSALYRATFGKEKLRSRHGGTHL